jgi:hypothetical protein
LAIPWKRHPNAALVLAPELKHTPELNSNSHFGGGHEAEDLVLKEQSASRWLLSP